MALRRTGDPFFTFSFSKGTMTFGGCICSRSSFFGVGAFTSSGPNCSGCADGPFFVAGAGLMVSLHVVSSVPDGFVARAV